MRDLQTGSLLALLNDLGKTTRGLQEAGRPAAGPVAAWDLVDGVDLGLPESEKRHQPLGSFTQSYGLPQTDYSGPENIAGSGIVVHWRDWAAYTGIHLNMPQELLSRTVIIRLLLATYQVGEPTAPSKPIKVLAQTDTQEINLGRVDIPHDGRWHLAELPAPSKALGFESLPGWFNLLLDDRNNVPTDEHHWGRRLAQVRLLVRRSE